MSLIVEETKGVELIDEGVYMAVCKSVIDIGGQYSEMYKKVNKKVIVIWEIPSLIATDKDGNEYARTISKEYTASLNERGNLTKDLNAWRGKAFTPEELKGFDLKNIIGVGCQLQIIHTTKNDKPRQNIGAIMALPKGMKVAAKDLPYYFDMDDPNTWANYQKIPEWICKKIESSENFNGSELQKFIISMPGKEAGAENSNNGFMEVPEDPNMPF